MLTKDEYAIVGLGITRHGKVPGISARRFQAEACRLAIEDAGLTREDIDGYIYETPPSGRETGQSEDAPPRMLGLPLSFYWQLDSGGTSTIAGIAAAMGAIELGLAQYVAVVFGDNAYSAARSPFQGQRPFERSPRTVAAAYGQAGPATTMSPIARVHMERYGTTSRQLGAITVAARKYAAVNPEARFYKKPITIEDHQNSPMVSDPLRLLDCCMQSDGGAAVIVTSAERARNCKSKPVLIKGIGMGNHLKMIAQGRNRDCLAESDAGTAGRQAFRMAGIELADIDLALIYDAFTIVLLLQLEDYGFCKKGEGGPFVESGNLEPGSKIPINPSGGKLGWTYLVGFTPLIEAVRQIRGQCGNRQVEGVELAMATGFANSFTMTHGHGHPRVCGQACIILG